MKPVSKSDSIDLINFGLYKDATPREIRALTSPDISIEDKSLTFDIRIRIRTAREYFRSIGKYEGN